MRSLGAVLATLALAAAVAGSAGGGQSSVATVKIPLPPPNTATFVHLSVKSGGPIQVSAANAKVLGGRALNTQAVVAWKSVGKGMYSLVVVIHRFTAVNARRLGSASDEALVDLVIAGPQAYARVTGAVPCTSLLNWGYLDDAGFVKNGWHVPENIVPSNDTNAEEQMDGAGYAKCPSTAEKDDPGSG